MSARDFPIGPFGPRIEIDADGTWLADGEPVVHPAVMAELVGRLGRRADGTYVIRAGGGELPIAVADAPFVVRAVALDRTPEGRLAAVRALLSDGTEEPVEVTSVRRLPRAPADRAGERLACAVKGGRFEARLSRVATYQLLSAGEPAGPDRVRLDTTAGPVVL